MKVDRDEFYAWLYSRAEDCGAGAHLWDANDPRACPLADYLGGYISGEGGVGPGADEGEPELGYLPEWARLFVEFVDRAGSPVTPALALDILDGVLADAGHLGDEGLAV